MQHARLVLSGGLSTMDRHISTCHRQATPLVWNTAYFQRKEVLNVMTIYGTHQSEVTISIGTMICPGIRAITSPSSNQAGHHTQAMGHTSKKYKQQTRPSHRGSSSRAGTLQWRDHENSGNVQGMLFILLKVEQSSNPFGSNKPRV